MYVNLVNMPKWKPPMIHAIREEVHIDHAAHPRLRNVTAWTTMMAIAAVLDCNRNDGEWLKDKPEVRESRSVRLVMHANLLQVVYTHTKAGHALRNVVGRLG